MFYQTFLSPQEKRYAIITYKHSTYELPIMKFEIGNYENFVKSCRKLMKNRN